jgi:four helix bundle protein
MICYEQERITKEDKKFSHDCVQVALSLPDTVLGRHIRGQLIRCSTSVSANYRAANLAHSKVAFAAKLSIVLEEADESGFWLEFATEENILSENISAPLIKESFELTSIFIASRKTIQTGGNNK